MRSKENRDDIARVGIRARLTPERPDLWPRSELEEIAEGSYDPRSSDRSAFGRSTAI